MQEAPPVSAEQRKTIALQILDAIFKSGRMDYYSDYFALREAISLIQTSETPNKKGA